MGMFDTISVSGHLPFSQEMIDLGLDKNNLSFQTKDLDCTMSHYIIQNGELFEEKYKTQEWIKGDENAKSIIDKIGYLDRKDPYLEKVNFHGEIYFYELLANVQDKWDCWVEFKAIFSHGKIEKIELFEFKKTDAEERKKRDREFWLQAEKEKNLWYNKYIFYTRIYRLIRIKWTLFCLKIANIFQKLA